jgi:hypothetical protein
LAQETSKEKTITFTSVVEASAHNLIALLPKVDAATAAPETPASDVPIELSKH